MESDQSDQAGVVQTDGTGVPDHPFAITLGLLAVRCSLVRPLHTASREGATLATTLRGALGSALLDLGCVRRPRCSVDEGSCQQPSPCPVAWLYKPRSASQRRHHAPPLALVPTQEGDALAVSVRLWGQHANDHAPLILDAFRRAGEIGLVDDGEAVCFSLAVARPLEVRPLREWVRGEPGPSARLVAIDFTTPCDADEPSPARLAGQAAHDLVQWQLEDTGGSGRLGKSGCDALADTARTAAVRSFRGSRLTLVRISRVDLGRRTSASNHRPFRLAGFTGTIRLAGSLDSCLPWLRALVFRGAGRRRAFGLGEVRLRIL